jgi:hypothetical protein
VREKAVHIHRLSRLGLAVLPFLVPAAGFSMALVEHDTAPSRLVGAVQTADPSRAVVCSGPQLTVRVTPGLAGTGHWSSLITVENAGSSPCRVSGYPGVAAIAAGGGAPADALASPRGFSGGLPAGASIPRITLQKGEVATALLEGTDIPIGNATTCPSYVSLDVTLPGGAKAVTLDQRIGSCSGLTVHPFVVGFNGSFPTGEVVGRAPACRVTAHGQASIGPFVQIDAWSGSDLAGSVMVFSGRNAAARYQLVLRPGVYRIHSAHDRSSVRAIVSAGRTVDLGSYGHCSEVVSVPTTFPSGLPPTTTTPPP